MISPRTFIDPTHTAMKYQRADMKTWFTMRVHPARDNLVELRYSSLLLTLFSEKWSMSCNSSLRPKGVPRSFDMSPVAAHFH